MWQSLRRSFAPAVIGISALQAVVPSLAAAGPDGSAAPTACDLLHLPPPALETPGRQAELRLLSARKSAYLHPEVPDVTRLHLPAALPDASYLRAQELSAGLTDPILEEARRLHVFE